MAATLAIGLSVDFTLHYGVAYSAAALASRSHQNHAQGDAVTQAVTQMCGPVTMAALTTLLPGGISFFVESRLNLIHLKLPMASTWQINGTACLKNVNNGLNTNSYLESQSSNPCLNFVHF